MAHLGINNTVEWTGFRGIRDSSAKNNHPYKSIMDGIDSGEYDGIIEEGLRMERKRIEDASSREYMDWVAGVVSSGKSVFDDDHGGGLDAEMVNRIPALYDFLVHELSIMPECSGEGVFCSYAVNILYKGTAVKVMRSYCGEDIVTGIMPCTGNCTEIIPYGASWKLIGG